MTLRMAVIGAGVMGAAHVRVIERHPAATLVAVADVDIERASRIARGTGAAVYESVEAALNSSPTDAVIVATPTNTHSKIATAALRADCHVLVEKPLASTAVEGQTLVCEAAQAQRVLAVGYVERFNPAITAAIGALDHVRPIVSSTGLRLGPAPLRHVHGGVALDLLVHEIDMIEYVSGSAILSAAGAVNADCTVAEVLVQTQSGMSGFARADWASSRKIRRLLIIGERGTIDVDYLQQTTIVRMADGNTTSLAIHREEPLPLEVDAFIEAIVTGQPFPVTPESALRSLSAALNFSRAVGIGS